MLQFVRHWVGIRYLTPDGLIRSVDHRMGALGSVPGEKALPENGGGEPGIGWDRFGSTKPPVHTSTQLLFDGQEF